MLRGVFSKITRFFFVITFLVGLTSCIGIFYDRHRISVYKPPDSAEGRFCVTGCTHAKSRCAEQCEKRAKECSVQKRHGSTIGNMVGLIGEFVRGTFGFGEMKKVSHGSCKVQREQCSSGCESGNSNCFSKCEIEYRSCSSSSVGLGINFEVDSSKFMPSKSTCNTHECERMCDSNYSACFLKCGGSVYSETSNQAE